MRQLGWCSRLAISVAALNCAALADDAMDGQLAQARSTYQTEFAAARKALVSALEKHRATAVAKDDSQQAAVLERELDALEKNDLLPGSLPAETRDFLNAVASSKKRLVAALQRGEKHYQDRNDAQKKRALEQEERALESVGPRSIGLLNAIQPGRDGIGGGWSFGAGGLVFNGGASAGRVRIPFASKLSEEYEVDLTVRRKSGGGELTLGFQSANAHAVVVLDGYDGQTSGIGLINGREANANASTKHQPFFRGDKPVKLTLTVRNNRVSVKSGGREFLAWDGSPEKLSLPREYQKDATPLFLAGSQGAELEIQGMTLRYLPPAAHTGEAETVAKRPAAQAETEKNPSGALSNGRQKEQGVMPTGSVWIGTVHSQLNGNANGDCRVTVRKASGDERTVQVEQAKDHAIFTLNLKLKGNSVTITNIDSLYAGRGHGGKPTVTQFSGSGQLDGQALNLQFSFRYNEGLSDSWCTSSAGAQNQLVTETLSVRAK